MPGSVWEGVLELFDIYVIGRYVAEPTWLEDIEIEIVEAALSLPGLDQTPP